MSLLKLLSAAKSLDGSKPMPSPYKMKSARFLPKFGSSKNPFARAKTEAAKPDAKSGSGRMETDSLFDNEPKPAPVAPKAPAVKEVKPISQPEKKIEAQPVVAVPAPAPIAREKKPGVIAGLVKKFNPVKFLPKRRPESGAVRPKTARAAQGELALEKVRVLRNELTDSDLEFVAAKTATATGLGMSGSILPEASRPGLTAWGRLTSRVVGAVETQTQ